MNGSPRPEASAPRDIPEVPGDAGSVATAASRRARRWSSEAGEELGTVLRALMARPWLVSGRDDELVAAVRRHEGPARDVLARLGWVLVVERDLVRLRKSPPVRRADYAADGPGPATCSWFFLLVAAAESLPPKVSIGQLVTAARAAAAEAGVPVCHDLPERRAIAAALRLLDERGVVERMDGDLEGFLTDENAPVLLAVHHTRLLHVVANFAPVDPVADPQGWLEVVEREPDPARRMRRRLVDDTCVHAEDLDPEEADWLSRRVRGDDGLPLARAFGLHLERRAEGAAFVVPDEAFRHPRELGPRVYPGVGTVAHAAMVLMDEAAADGTVHPDRPGWRMLTESDVLARLAAKAAQMGAGRGAWSAEDVANPHLLAAKVAALLTALDLIRISGPAPGRPASASLPSAHPTAGRSWWFSPVTGRWAPPSPVVPGRGRRARRQPVDAPGAAPALDLAGIPATSPQPEPRAGRA